MSLTANNISLSRTDKTILEHVSLDIEPGIVTALIGPNGAGKTSLMRIMTGEMNPDDGDVAINGLRLRRLSFAELARVRAVMTQSSHVVFDFRVDEILRMGWVQGSRWNQEAMAQAIDQVTAACDIEDLIGRTFNTLSGGEQQRVQFARALLQIWRPSGSREARYLMLDEPTSSLDLAHELIVLKLAREKAGKNIGVLVVLHDLNLAARFADRVCLLKAGEIVAEGRPEQVFEDRLLTGVYGTTICVEQSQRFDRLLIHSM
ncbi:MAG: heme ABC transporter ATP-binding protein [Gammaproteobacteria bacterium]|nr:heme ABC transporter ATP-binding protein [Gammaproteobacteria bacterium]